MWLPERTIFPAIAGALALVTLLSAATVAKAADDLPSLLKDAERARQEGRLTDAGSLFDKAQRGWPQDEAAARGFCEIGLAIAGTGTIGPAVGAACHKVFLSTYSARDMRNKAAALLSEKARPNLDALALAAIMADASLKKSPEQPWGFLARRDIASRIGRADLLAASESDLRHFTGDPIVRAALQVPVGRAPASIWLLRILVLLGLVGTGVHALVHRRRTIRPRQPLSPTEPAAVLLTLFTLLTPSLAFAEPVSEIAKTTDDMPILKDKFSQMSPFKIDDAHPDLAVKELLAKSKDPLQLGYLLQDLAVRADDAATKGDLARAARYYHALGLAAPTPYGPQKECEALEAIGDIPNAIRACRELLQRSGVTVSDYAHFVDVVLKNPQPLPDLEPKELEAVIAHLEKAANTGSLPTILRCKVALRFNDPGPIQTCATAMSSIPAGDPAVIAIKWGLAVRQNDKSQALILLERGRRAGMSNELVLRMSDTTNAMGRPPYRKIVAIAGLAVVILTVGFFAARMLAANRQRTANRSAV